MPIAMLIWSDLMYEGIDVAVYAQRSLDRVNKNLDVIDKALDEWNWVSEINARPVTVADCMLWEELNQARTVFGPAFSLDDKPLLAQFYAEHPGRETFEYLLAENPCQISGRPGEAAAISNIQNFLQPAK